MDKLDLLRDLRQHKGWAVFEELIELRLGETLDQLSRVQPQDETNFRRGVLSTYATLTGQVDKILQELDNYHARRSSDDRKRLERKRGPDISQHWGSSHFYGGRT